MLCSRFARVYAWVHIAHTHVAYWRHHLCSVSILITSVLLLFASVCVLNLDRACCRLQARPEVKRGLCGKQRKPWCRARTPQSDRPRIAKAAVRAAAATRMIAMQSRWQGRQAEGCRRRKKRSRMTTMNSVEVRVATRTVCAARKNRAPKKRHRQQAKSLHLAQQSRRQLPQEARG